MSIDQWQRTVNRLDKEINDLEKKKVAKDRECRALQNKINSTKKSITKNSSQTTIKNKMQKVNSYQNNLDKKSSESMELGNKIADKKNKRTEANLKLQKEQRREKKKEDRENQRIQDLNEARIEELQQQLERTDIMFGQNNVTGEEEYDVFVSHAWEDKAEFVDEFVLELRKQELKVWYDTDKLKWGDSMREKIDKGLSKSCYGVVILSPNYIAEEKYWTKAELNGLFQVETVNGKRILPIWHNLTKKQVAEYSPIIADRKAMTTTTMTPKEMAFELKRLCTPVNMENNSNE